MNGFANAVVSHERVSDNKSMTHFQSSHSLPEGADCGRGTAFEEPLQSTLQAVGQIPNGPSHTGHRDPAAEPHLRAVGVVAFHPTGDIHFAGDV